MNATQYAQYANNQYNQWLLQAQSLATLQVLGDALSRLVVVFVVVAILMIVFAAIYQALKGREFSDEFAINCLWGGLLVGMFISALVLPVNTVMVLKDNPVRFVQREYKTVAVEGQVRLFPKIYVKQQPPSQPCDQLLNQPGAQMLPNITLTDDQHWLGVWGHVICVAYRDSSDPNIVQSVTKVDHFWVLQGALQTSQIIVIDGGETVKSSLQAMGDTHCKVAPQMPPNLDDTSTNQLHLCP